MEGGGHGATTNYGETRTVDGQALLLCFLVGVASGILGVVALILFGRWYVAEGRRRFPDAFRLAEKVPTPRDRESARGERDRSEL